MQKLLLWFMGLSKIKDHLNQYLRCEKCVLIIFKKYLNHHSLNTAWCCSRSLIEWSRSQLLTLLCWVAFNPGRYIFRITSKFPGESIGGDGREKLLIRIAGTFLFMHFSLSLEEEGAVQTNSSLGTLFQHICDLDKITIWHLGVKVKLYSCF